jgi:(R,R)-butanediol dehydrogenase / meso-butanediol dehydrogenase / diacetyl reductase
MRAAVYAGTEDVTIQDVPEPTGPGPGELTLEVSLAGICGTDASEFRRGPTMIPLEAAHHGSGHRGPTVLGHEFIGTVTAVGADVAAFSVGDRVACGAGVSCGDCDRCREGRTNLRASYYTLGLHTNGGLAQRINAPASCCVAIPDDLSGEDAVLAQPLAIAVHALDRGRVSAGDSVLFLGLGGVGSLALPAAAVRGVSKIIAADIDPRKLEAARRLGADETLLATDPDFERRVQELAGGAGPDVVLELSGVPENVDRAVRMVRPGGRVVLVGLAKGKVEFDPLEAVLKEIEFSSSLAHVCATDIPAALEILMDPKIRKEVVDRTVSLEDAVDEGLRPLAEGKVAGKVLIRLAG